MSMEEFQKQWDEAQARVRAHLLYQHFGISKYKSCDGMDGCAFSCNLTFRGSVVGTAMNSGSGGPDDIRHTILLGSIAWQELIKEAQQEIEPESLVLDCLLNDMNV